MKTNHKKNSLKLFWSLLLFVDVLLFIDALSTTTIWACLLVMILSELIYFKGNKYLFGEFDRKQQLKREQRKQKYLQNKESE
ncbi:hypothetical protein C5Z26_07890 [Lactobacillus sp. CBA3606]|uniref:hypothetical protein n=1 Tax=Lactobacillus sp. CBA3606 TaxID=2099789 RepID=UPI000CFD81B2|nr:hypothetical protein [Lactobacillus sp. CBA3606]AVK64036.1 hypothetical protein C5Z26_07890 [Lactobacillus sp. CBA3606]